MTAQLGPQGEPSAPHQPVTFRSRLSFVGLPQLKAYSSMHLHFQFKTLEPSGLLLYNAGKGQDFVAVELVDGHLHYLFNLGDGPRKVCPTMFFGVIRVRCGKCRPCCYTVFRTILSPAAFNATI